MILFTTDLKEGMKLSKAVYHGSSILVEKGITLNKTLIEKICNFGINHVEVEDVKISEEAMQKVFEQEEMLKESFVHDYNKSVDQAKIIIENLKAGKIEKEKIDTIVNDTLNNIEIDKNILLGLLESKKDNNYIFRHSINTVTLSLILGMAIDYDEKQLKLLGKGAFLHDVGMTRIPEQILNKESELLPEEIEEIKKHCDYGLKMVGKVEKEVEEIIRYHHERMDGSGYPEGLKGEEIPEMARIIAIADVYAALTEDRKHRNKYSYYDAMKIVMQSSTNLLDAVLLKKFLRYMPVYPINSQVILNDGRAGIVAKANDNPFRPVVDVKQDGKMERIDLMSQEHLVKCIVGVKK